MRQNGITREQVDFINTKIAKPYDDLPDNIAYATYNNQDKCAINEGIFLEFLKQTHSLNIQDKLPEHTIVVKASNLKLQVERSRRYRDMPQLQQYCLVTGCSDANII